MFFIPGGCPAASAGSGAEPQGVEAAGSPLRTFAARRTALQTSGERDRGRRPQRALVAAGERAGALLESGDGFGAR